MCRSTLRAEVLQAAKVMTLLGLGGGVERLEALLSGGGDGAWSILSGVCAWVRQTLCRGHQGGCEGDQKSRTSRRPFVLHSRREVESQGCILE